MSQTTSAASIKKPRLETLKRFFHTLASPSPLGWIIVAGLSYTSSALLIGNLIALPLLIPAIYTGLFGLNVAVSALKQAAIDQQPSPEYLFWGRITKRLIRTAGDYRGLILIATFGQMAMTIPTLLDNIWAISAVNDRLVCQKSSFWLSIHFAVSK